MRVTKKQAKAIGSAIAAALFALGMVAYASSAPDSFPVGISVSIKQGSTLDQAAAILAEDGLIRSTTLFKTYVTVMDGMAGVKAGEYLFYKPQSSLTIAYRLVRGDFGFQLVKVTIPEGVTVADIGNIVARNIKGFDSAGFVKMAAMEEGYLFPDTYFWPANVSPNTVMSDMRAESDSKLGSLAADIKASGRREGDIVKMASIVEKESPSSADRKIIAGILWKRLDMGMPLQADPTRYTYEHTGLPPTPIDNPGLEAIQDTLHPTASPYLYYLSDKSGNMHYATTLQGQDSNIAKYLD